MIAIFSDILISGPASYVEDTSDPAGSKLLLRESQAPEAYHAWEIAELPAGEESESGNIHGED